MQRVECVSNKTLRLVVQRRRCLVEHQNSGPSIQSPSDANSLPLTTRQLDTTFPDSGVYATFNPLDEYV